MSNGINWGLMGPAQDPSSNFLRGIQGGLQLRAQNEQRAMNQEKMNAWRQDRADAQYQADMQMQAAQANQQEFNEALRNFRMNPNKDTSFALKMSMPKELQASVDEYNATANKEDIMQKRNMVAPVISLLRNGRTDLAKEKALQASAYLQDKDPELAKMALDASKMIDASPESALEWLDTSFAIGDMEGYEILNKGKLAGSQSRETDVKAKKLRKELDAMSDGSGKIPFEKRPDAEDSLRKEYTTRIADPEAVINSFDQIMTTKATGPGDIAMITTFMKLLDPGSVVREGEFLTAAKANGILESLTNAYDKVSTGTLLTPKARETFRSQAKAIVEVAKKRKGKVDKEITGISKRRGLNIDNIIFQEEPSKPPVKDGEESVSSFVDKLLEF